MSTRVPLQVWLLAFLLFFTVSELAAQVKVRGYTRKDGTYVQPHYRSRPDGNFYNNWSTKGNVNPYTGKEGTLTAPRTPSYNLPTPRYAPAPLTPEPPMQWTPSPEIAARNQRLTLQRHGVTDEEMRGKTDAELFEMECKISKAEELKKRGVTVDWRTLSFRELNSLQHKLDGHKLDEPAKVEQTAERAELTEEEIKKEVRAFCLRQLKKKAPETAWEKYSDDQLVEIVQLILGWEKTPATHFTIGSTKAEVLEAQGTPDSVQETWFRYGFSTVNFKDGRVSSWSNIDKNLKARLTPDQLR